MAPDHADALAAALRDELRMGLGVAPFQYFPQGRNVYSLPVAVIARSPCDVVKRNQRSHLAVVRPVRRHALNRMVGVNEDRVHSSKGGNRRYDGRLSAVADIKLRLVAEFSAD